MAVQERKIFTLTQLTLSLENHFLTHFASRNFWVTAEIAKINHKGGHYYLELADSENDRTTALMSATIWRTAYQQMREKIGADLPGILKSGNKALFLIKIEFHKIYGLKLNILQVDPTYSYGEIERKKQETILQLKKEGLYEKQHSLYLPVISKRIAVIGSPGTSGYRDFLKELLENDVYRNFKYKTFAASVQGDKAAAEIIAAIEEARLYKVDVIVIIRGGGSKMDLNVFNDYTLSKTMAETSIPIITGIGHESDETVADLVARKACITPTAAAKYLYISIGSFSAELRSAYDAVRQQSVNLLSGAKDEFYHQSKYLLHFSQQLLIENQYDLRGILQHLQLGFLEMINSEDAKLDARLDRIATKALHHVQLVKDADLPAKMDRIQMMSQNQIDQKQLHLKGIEELLRMLDPQRLLDNGYTISTIDDMDLNQFTGDMEGKEMKTLTAKHLISSQITKSEKRK